MPSPVRAERFVINPGSKDNLVKFESHAPMESFDGKTRAVLGELEFDPDQLSDSVTVRIEVDLTELDTGIGLRNRHMRQNHLETDEYPKAVFRGGRILEPSASALGATPVTFQLAGTFELHGVTREVIVDAEVVRNEDGSIQLVSRFEVKLSDYQISRPKFLMLKLDEVQKITVDVTAIPMTSAP
jgi:polyisoprenoid-binding protein YceI